MKKELKTTALTTIVVVSSLYSRAQQLATPPPPPLQGQPRPGTGGPNKRSFAPLQQLVTVTGKVMEYTANDRWEFDRLSLQQGDKVVTVKFPAHLAGELMAAAPKGAEISISGTTDDGPEGPLFRLYRLKAGSKEIINTPPAPSQLASDDEVKSFSGTVSEFTRGRNGEINGVVLNNNILVKLPPTAVEQLTAYLKDGASVSGTGVNKLKPNGVVMARNIRITDAQTISINGQTYLLR